MKTMATLVRKLQGATIVFLAFVLAAMMCVIFLQTFTRYVVFYSLPWSEELSRYMFVALVCLGINVGVTRDLMIRIDNIDYKLSERMKHWFAVGRLTVELTVSVFLLVSSFDIIRIGRFQKSPAMQIPMHYLYSVMAVGFGLAILAILLKLAETVAKKEA
jgi:TRAP-type C4-dicarboxylate transport system permease small subunit